MNERGLDRFDIDKFILKACQFELVDLYDYVQNQIKWVEKMPLPKQTTEQKYVSDIITNYRWFLLGVADLLQSGNKPHMKDEDFAKTKPIVESLIKKGNWIKEAINIYNPDN